MIKQKLYITIIVVALVLGCVGCIQLIRKRNGPVPGQETTQSNLDEQRRLAEEQVATVAAIEEKKKTDRDLDGLSDEKEKSLGTNPESDDTDNDGISDWTEVALHGTDPLKKDTDGDGRSDNYELDHGTNPKGSGSYTFPSTTLSTY